MIGLGGAGNRNVISGNNYNGIFINGGGSGSVGADSNTIQNNYIGLTVRGSSALGNGRNGILVTTCNLTAILDHSISGNGTLGAGSGNNSVRLISTGSS